MTSPASFAAHASRGQFGYEPREATLLHRLSQSRRGTSDGGLVAERPGGMLCAPLVAVEGVDQEVGRSWVRGWPQRVQSRRPAEGIPGQQRGELAH